VRNYASKQKEIEAGMAGKSAEFRERGADAWPAVVQAVRSMLSDSP
jgi:hypothetical protein